LYAGIGIALDLPFVITVDAPHMLQEASIPPRIISSVVPMGTVALDSNPTGQSKVNDPTPDAHLFLKGDSMSPECIGHENFKIGAGGGAAEALHGAEAPVVVTLLDSKSLPAILADDLDTAFDMQAARMG